MGGTLRDSEEHPGPTVGWPILQDKLTTSLPLAQHADETVSLVRVARRIGGAVVIELDRGEAEICEELPT